MLIHKLARWIFLLADYERQKNNKIKSRFFDKTNRGYYRVLWKLICFLYKQEVT